MHVSRTAFTLIGIGRVTTRPSLYVEVCALRATMKATAMQWKRQEWFGWCPPSTRQRCWWQRLAIHGALGMNVDELACWLVCRWIWSFVVICNSPLVSTRLPTRLGNVSETLCHILVHKNLRRTFSLTSCKMHGFENVESEPMWETSR